MSQTVLRLPIVKARVGLSRSTIYKFIAEGTFPAAVRLGPRAVGWLEHEIQDWIVARAQSRAGTSDADALE